MKKILVYEIIDIYVMYMKFRWQLVRQYKRYITNKLFTYCDKAIRIQYQNLSSHKTPLTNYEKGAMNTNKSDNYTRSAIHDK